MALKIRNGQFVDESGNVVKPEFGNREMILAFNKLQQKAELWSSGVKVKKCVEEEDDDDGEVWWFLKGVCKCGSNMTTDFTYRQDLSKFEGMSMECANDKCYAFYEIVYREDINECRAVNYDDLHKD